jgi:hypothetical protein
MISYILACIGLTFIIKYGSILNFIRKPLSKIIIFEELLKCSLCIGFWSGVFIGSFAYFNTLDHIFLLMPLISASVCWFSDTLLGLLQSLEIYLDSKNK